MTDSDVVLSTGSKLKYPETQADNWCGIVTLHLK